MKRYEFVVDCAFNEDLVESDTGPVVKWEDAMAMLQLLRECQPWMPSSRMCTVSAKLDAFLRDQEGK